MTEQPSEEDDQLSVVLSRLIKFEGKDLIDKITDILDTKLNNEYMIGESLREGIRTGVITVEEAAKLIVRSKDSISDLSKVKQLLGGGPTERITLSVEEREEIEALRRVILRMGEN